VPKRCGFRTVRGLIRALRNQLISNYEASALSGTLFVESEIAHVLSSGSVFGTIWIHNEMAAWPKRLAGEP
jgi:hypothetical protein